MKSNEKVAIVLPAFNAERTLLRTLAEIPPGYKENIILVDDASRDKTVQLAKEAGLKVIVHEKNRGYGGNQKTCYKNALLLNADIVVMLHPDHQYDAQVIPELIQPIVDGEADAVFGSRMLGGRPMDGGMPWSSLPQMPSSGALMASSCSTSSAEGFSPVIPTPFQDIIVPGSDTTLVNINTASSFELETLPGIGSTTAQKIIEYRETNGPFISTEDIINVSGVGPGTYERIKDLITVGP